MFSRIEVAVRPEFADPQAQTFLRRLELALPAVRPQVRWARHLDVAWIDLQVTREELIPAMTEVFWDRVTHWVFTGNLIPSAAGKSGGLQDLMETAPHRPGKFWAIERRFRGGVTDNVGRTALEAFDIVLSRGNAGAGARTASGSLLLLEGPELNEETLGAIAREVFCNELIETFMVLTEGELKKNDRFHPERVKSDFPRVFVRSSCELVETVDLKSAVYSTPEALEALSKKRLWALNREEMIAVREYFYNSDIQAKRARFGLAHPTDVELECIAQTWSEHCKHKIFAAQIEYKESTASAQATPYAIIPNLVDGLFKTTIAGTTREIQKPWLLSVFDDNAGVIAFDDEDAICIKVETHNSPSALDPYGGALTGIVGVNRDILGCGMGARPIFNTDVFCVAPLQTEPPLPERILHPRRILEGVRRGVEHGGNKSGIPTVNGALVFDPRFLGKPLVFCGTGGILPQKVAGGLGVRKEIQSGDRVVMIGGRVGKDGIHGATFSSLALDEFSPVSAVQLGDPITQKRMSDFLLEARDQGLFRAVTDNGAGGLSSSVGELAQLSGGARIDVSKAKTKYPGLKPFELLVSESQERMTLAVSPDRLEAFMRLAQQRGVEASDLGEFTNTGSFEVFYGEQCVAVLDLSFLHKGCPRLRIQAEWNALSRPGVAGPERSFEKEAKGVLLRTLARPNIASKEWLIRQYDHEVQGSSVIKPLQTVHPGTPMAACSPNDAAVLKPKASSQMGVVVGCGIQPRMSDWDPYLMAQLSVDEAVRNVLCSGAEFGTEDAVLALVDNFCWPDPLGDTPDARQKAGALVRACFGLREAALALKLPFVSGKDSMKNDYRGKIQNLPVKISVPPTLLVTAVGRIKDVGTARSSEFKSPGDAIYLLGATHLALGGSEVGAMLGQSDGLFGEAPLPNWKEALSIYRWIGGASGKEQLKIRSLHDVSEGGLLVALAEACMARGLGAQILFPQEEEPWSFGFGEGFHSFIASCKEVDSQALELEWSALGVPFCRLGQTVGNEKLEISWGKPNPFLARGDSSMPRTAHRFEVSMGEVKNAWQRGGGFE